MAVEHGEDFANWCHYVDLVQSMDCGRKQMILVQYFTLSSLVDPPTTFILMKAHSVSPWLATYRHICGCRAHLEEVRRSVTISVHADTQLSEDVLGVINQG